MTKQVFGEGAAKQVIYQQVNARPRWNLKRSGHYKLQFYRFFASNPSKANTFGKKAGKSTICTAAQAERSSLINKATHLEADNSLGSARVECTVELRQPAAIMSSLYFQKIHVFISWKFATFPPASVSSKRVELGVELSRCRLLMLVWERASSSGHTLWQIVFNLVNYVSLWFIMLRCSVKLLCVPRLDCLNRHQINLLNCAIPFEIDNDSKMKWETRASSVQPEL